MESLLEKKVNNEMKEVLISKIKQRISLLDITQKEIEDKTGIDQRNISSILKYGRGGLVQLIKIAESVGLSFSDDELEAKTSYWIKAKGELREYFYSKTNEALAKGIYKHLDVIRFVQESFESGQII